MSLTWRIGINTSHSILWREEDGLGVWAIAGEERRSQLSDSFEK
jgi:hypothetical protein